MLKGYDKIRHSERSIRMLVPMYTAIPDSPFGEVNPVYFQFRNLKNHRSIKLIVVGVVGLACVAAIVGLIMSRPSITPPSSSHMQTLASDPPSQIHLAHGNVVGDSMVVSWMTKTNVSGVVRLHLHPFDPFECILMSI